MGQSLKIAIVIPDFARNNTAFQAQVKTYEFIAQEYGCKVTVFANKTFVYQNDWLEVKNLRRIGGRFWCPPYPALLPQLLGYDVIITDDPSLYPHAIWAALVSKWSKSRLILDTSMTLLSPAKDTWKGRLILGQARAIFNLSHRVIVTTPLTANRLVKLGLLPETSDKVVELGHPVDTDLFHPVGARPNNSDVNILSVGKLIYEKGHHIVIESLADLLRSYDHLRLLIAGEGPYRPALEEICRRHGVADKVSFLGFVPNEQLSEIYRECHIFVHHPITIEGWWEEFFGVVAVEAMSSGLPLIVSDCGGLKYLVPEDAGFMIGQEDREMLREKVKLLVENPTLRDDMGAQGRAFVCRRYSIPVVARRCYEEVLI